GARVVGDRLHSAGKREKVPGLGRGLFRPSQSRATHQALGEAPGKAGAQSIPGTRSVIGSPLSATSPRSGFSGEEAPMACKPELLKAVPLFALLDNEEAAVLASQVELEMFATRERIYRIGDSGGQAYLMVSGKVRV